MIGINAIYKKSTNYQQIIRKNRKSIKKLTISIKKSIIMMYLYKIGWRKKDAYGQKKNNSEFNREAKF